MSIRTDKVSGIITCAFGIVMIGFATFGLLIVALSRVLISTMPPIPQGPDGASFTQAMHAMHAIHGVWFIYLPLMIAGGIVFAVCGFCVHRGSLAARRVAQANAICGYIWVTAYSISCYQIMDIIGPPPDVLPEPARTALHRSAILVGTLIHAAFPTGLLYILSRPRNQTAKMLPQPAKEV
jgi:hypothetical protein